MENIDSGGHPRPVVEVDEEPPTKQLKLSVEDQQIDASGVVLSPDLTPVAVDYPVTNHTGERTRTAEALRAHSVGVVVVANEGLNVNGDKILPENEEAIFDAISRHGIGERSVLGMASAVEGSKIEKVSPVSEHEAGTGASSTAVETANEAESKAVVAESAQARTNPAAEPAGNRNNSEDLSVNNGCSSLNGKSSNGLRVLVEATAVNRLPTDLAGEGAAIEAGERTKTSLCSYFRKKGCRHGTACRYAHGEEELRPRSDGSWDPTSERARSILEKTTPAPAAGVDPAPVADSGIVEDGIDPSSVVPEKAAPPNVGKDDSTANALSKCIVHVPRGWSVDHFKAFLTENGILYTTAKKRKGMSVAFVGFQTPEDVAKATETLHGKTVNKKQLVVAESRSRSWEKAAASADGSVSNMAGGNDYAVDGEGKAAGGITDGRLDGKAFEDGDLGESELAAMSRNEPPRNVCDAVTPLAHLTYEEQLHQKRDNVMQILKRLVRNTRKGVLSGGLLPEWILSARDRGGLPCALDGVLASPLVDGYRNKCEFTIGCSADGRRVVGFQIGAFREAMLAVAEPTDCRNVSIIARSYAAIFQKFVENSELPVWDKKTNSGFWRLFIVREGRAGRLKSNDAEEDSPPSIAEVMLVVQVCPNGIEKERMTIEYAKMTDFLSRAASSATPPLPLTALLVQDHVGISNVSSPDAPLHPLVLPDPGGDVPKANEYIYEHLSNLRFRLSPTAFFQVNTLAAERLYNVAGDWAGLTRDTLLFDVCCGTGTIGLTLAHRVGLVVGIEMNASAVADAQKNAEINDIANCQFVCGKAEDVMDTLLKKFLVAEESLAGENENEGTIAMVDEDEDGEDNGHMAQALQSEQIPSTTSMENNSEENLSTEKVPSSSSDSAVPGLGGENGVSDEPEKAGVVTPSSGQSDPLVKAAENVQNSRGLQRRKFQNVVAIVDPPRVGLHPTVLKTLRVHTELRRLVYISCNPDSLLANAVELCTPLSGSSNSQAEKGKAGWGGRANWKHLSNVGQARHRVKKMPQSEPFRPVRAVAVDLFPHTDHCEMVMLFER